MPDASRPDTVTIERPRSAEHGDYATNVALQLAKPVGRPPREVAEVLATHIRHVDGVAAVDVAGPGFLNITLEASAQGELARSIVSAGMFASRARWTASRSRAFASGSGPPERAETEISRPSLVKS